ncbi:CpaD family pilus assembly protein [Sphingomonas aerophila]|jgi:pilus assembly protein CpaD|uniref:Pilus assembly protein CpaD n=1 Tax=Sphingomonas aerophila TaxID=1344948 RepID=A0A7W9BEU0_9SPHN|nr:CpaD family pilus assembly protein [Sphingomonas aerophila]MBB5715935.1 pilus assembly protein CpaD [Sphingomonas aerophila]
MKMKTSLPLLVLPAVLLAGCAGGTQNRGLESVHQPVISRSDYLLDLSTVGGQLAAGESRRLAGWFGSMRLGYGDHVAVDDPAGDALTAREQVSTVVASYGLLLSDEAPITAATVSPGTVRVVVSRMRAGVPGCPDWSRNSSRDFDQHTSSNFGCASNSNLAAMVASPNDLVRGQSSGNYDAATGYRAIDAYRKATPTGGGGNTVKTENAGGK